MVTALENVRQQRRRTGQEDSKVERRLNAHKGAKREVKVHAVVCIKQVPDTTDVKIDRKTNTLIREGVPSIVNPFDTHAIEEALRLKDSFRGKVSVISMGPPQARESLKKAISYGVDQAILISDRALPAPTLWSPAMFWLRRSGLSGIKTLLIWCSVASKLLTATLLRWVRALLPAWVSFNLPTW
jgi:hypothetical protein